MTAAHDNFPSCPMFFAIMKELLVVAVPSMIKAATIFSSLNPISTQTGKNIKQKSTNLLKITSDRAREFSLIFENSNDAPSPVSAKGEATFAK